MIGHAGENHIHPHVEALPWEIVLIVMAVFALALLAARLLHREG